MKNLQQLPLYGMALAVLLNVCILTPIMTYLMLPLSTRLLRPWLQAPRRQKRPRNRL